MTHELKKADFEAVANFILAKTPDDGLLFEFRNAFSIACCDNCADGHECSSGPADHGTIFLKQDGSKLSTL